MKLTLVVSDNCAACERAKGMLRKIQFNNPEMEIETVNIDSLNDRKISITPALLVDNHLFSYGDIDEYKLIARLK